MDVLGKVRDIVDRVTATSGPEGDELPRICQELRALPDIDASDPIAFRYREYVIAPGFTMHLDREAEILRWVRGLDIAAAPELVALVPFAEGQAVLVSRYWACEGEILRPVRSLREPLQEQARRRFRRDLATLADNGAIHPYARGTMHWFAAERSETLVLNGWSALRRCNREECDDFLAVVDQVLSRSI